MSEVEIVTPPPAHPAMYPSDPADMVRVAVAQANELARLIEDKHLYANISGRRHVTVQGWTLLGAMAGVFPITEWSRRIEIDGSHGWEARVVAKHLSSGEIVGAAEGMCMDSEKTWGKRDEYARRSMAETRARSKALRGPLEFVMELAGFQTTPEEEMPGDMERTVPIPTESQLDDLRAILAQVKELEEGDVKDGAREAWAEVCGSAGTFPSTFDEAVRLLEALNALGFYPTVDQEPF